MYCTVSGKNKNMMYRPTIIIVLKVLTSMGRWGGVCCARRIIVILAFHSGENMAH